MPTNRRRRSRIPTHMTPWGSRGRGRRGRGRGRIAIGVRVGVRIRVGVTTHGDQRKKGEASVMYSRNVGLHESFQRPILLQVPPRHAVVTWKLTCSSTSSPHFSSYLPSSPSPSPPLSLLVLLSRSYQPTRSWTETLPVVRYSVGLPPRLLPDHPFPASESRKAWAYRLRWGVCIGMCSDHFGGISVGEVEGGRRKKKQKGGGGQMEDERRNYGRRRMLISDVDRGLRPDQYRVSGLHGREKKKAKCIFS